MQLANNSAKLCRVLLGIGQASVCLRVVDHLREFLFGSPAIECCQVIDFSAGDLPLGEVIGGETSSTPGTFSISSKAFVSGLPLEAKWSL